MKLLLDEMWPPAIAVQLRARGHDVASVAERTELRGQPDHLIFAAAQHEQRVIVTENVPDYRRLAQEHLQHDQSHAGLIFTSNRRFPRHDERTAGRLVTALDAFLATGADLVDGEHWLA